MSYRQPFKGDYPITQAYGVVIPGVTYKNRPHSGIDYGCPKGTPILASNDGVVVFSDFDNSGFGHLVTIQHNDGNATLYAHLSSRSVVLRQKVQQGEVIGYSGSTGNSTGPHLHFEARRQWNKWDSHFDPMLLPLVCIDDSIPAAIKLKDADELGENVKVVAPTGARRFNPDWTYPYPSAFNVGTELHFTGKTAKRQGFPYTYCEVYEEPKEYWVAVNDGETQILDNSVKGER